MQCHCVSELSLSFVFLESYGIFKFMPSRIENLSLEEGIVMNLNLETGWDHEQKFGCSKKNTHLMKEHDTTSSIHTEHSLFQPFSKLDELVGVDATFAV